MVVDLEESVYFKPDAGVFMLSPADETPVAAHDAFADDLDVAIAVDRFETLTDCPVHRVLAQWAGLRTMAPDRRPVIGFDPKVEGLFWLAGQGGFGIQTALGAAALGRNLIETGSGGLNELFADIAPLISPARFSAQEAGQSC
jgi:D-arginine dehydrogenase